MDTIVVGSDRRSPGHGKGRWCGHQHLLHDYLRGICAHGYRVNELLMICQPQLLSLTRFLVVCYVSNAESGDIIHIKQIVLGRCCDKREQVNGRQSNFLGFDRES